MKEVEAKAAQVANSIDVSAEVTAIFDETFEEVGADSEENGKQA